MTPALSLRGLRKVYRTGVEALRGIDLTVERGDFFALLGPNGAGKTTAIGIVCSLVKKTAGEVRVLGHDLERDWAQVRASIGLMPQEHNFNVWEPVVEILVNQAGYYGVPRREAFSRADALLEELGLAEWRLTQARSLSGGMKRRLMLARARLFLILISKGFLLMEINAEGPAEAQNKSSVLVPARAGIQGDQPLDSGIRRGDDWLMVSLAGCSSTPC